MSLPCTVRKCQSQGIKTSWGTASQERPEAGLAAKNRAGDGGMGQWGVQPGGLWGGVQAALGRLRMEEAGDQGREGMGQREWRVPAKARKGTQEKYGLRRGLDYSWGTMSRGGSQTLNPADPALSVLLGPKSNARRI